MGNTPTVTSQVHTAIESAHRNINAAGQLLPKDERELRKMSADIKEKMDDLIAGQSHISGFLSKNCTKKPIYS